ncbi:hypothetical protein NQ314_019381 [Rhamnusium bicolor]|uniref:Uncharacterized protein n=1 Tax=Rhamnusium bicolor TaxID=1586634 RepID=A0AAV8WP18_9CUCU|nr:hypothetical protein NQ314_019381 [Rhamnusium bicolor]
MISKDIESRYESIQSTLDEFSEIQNSIEACENKIESDDIERDEFEKAYFRLVAAFIVLIANYSRSKQFEVGSGQGTEKGSVHSERQSSINNATRVKLPTINLSKFYGNYMRWWLDFKEAFLGLIHENQLNSDYKKFVYL